MNIEVLDSSENRTSPSILDSCNYPSTYYSPQLDNERKLPVRTIKIH